MMRLEGLAQLGNLGEQALDLLDVLVRDDLLRRWRWRELLLRRCVRDLEPVLLRCLRRRCLFALYETDKGATRDGLDDGAELVQRLTKRQARSLEIFEITVLRRGLFRLPERDQDGVVNPPLDVIAEDALVGVKNGSKPRELIGDRLQLGFELLLRHRLDGVELHQPPCDWRAFLAASRQGLQRFGGSKPFSLKKSCSFSVNSKSSPQSLHVNV